MKNIMLDLETLGTKPGAIILSIGAVSFDPTGLKDEFHEVIQLSDCLNHGLIVDPNTLKWWKNQTPIAQETLEKARDKTTSIPLYEALSNFNDFVGDSDARVWGNGPCFDNAIIREAYLVVGLPPIWHFRGDMCYRTMRTMFPHVPLPERKGVHHNALDDAKFQAEHLLEILEKVW